MLFFSSRYRSVSEADRSSLSEPDATKEEEAENELYQATNRGVGKALSQTEIPGLRRASGVGEVAEDDGRAGEDLVPKQTDEMEVSLSRYSSWVTKIGNEKGFFLWSISRRLVRL